MNHLTAAVHLDRMLANLTDEAAETFARSAEERHPGLGDQLNAATHEADKVARHLGDIQTEHRGRSSIPAWLRIPALTELVSWGAGDSRTCRHAPSPLRPQPVMAAAHRPGLVSCLECAPALLRAHGEEDRRCDGCQRIVTGEADDPIFPGRLRIAALIFTFGTCSFCTSGTVKKAAQQDEGAA